MSDNSPIFVVLADDPIQVSVTLGGADGTTDYNSLSNRPTLGTAAALDAPATGNASASQLVKGNDSRLGAGGSSFDVTDWDTIIIDDDFNFESFQSGAANGGFWHVGGNMYPVPAASTSSADAVWWKAAGLGWLAHQSIGAGNAILLTNNHARINPGQDFDGVFRFAHVTGDPPVLTAIGQPASNVIQLRIGFGGPSGDIDTGPGGGFGPEFFGIVYDPAVGPNWTIWHHQLAGNWGNIAAQLFHQDTGIPFNDTTAYMVRFTFSGDWVTDGVKVWISGGLGNPFVSAGTIPLAPFPAFSLIKNWMFAMQIIDGEIYPNSMYLVDGFKAKINQRRSTAW
jgi:hypothetical protein